MTFKVFVHKVRDRLWHELVSTFRFTYLYPFFYKSYWLSLIFKNKSKNSNTNYMGARPNPGAGIGHQLANWIAGYWWAKQFGLQFAHVSFSTPKWETFLGFGESETSVIELIKKGYKKVRLPLFGQFNQQDLERTEKIIQSYSGQKVVFVCEQDQGYTEQYGVMADLKYKFRNAPARKDDTIEYDKSKFNIAVHVRRTVIIGNKVIEEDEAAKAKRWLSNDYYEKVLKQVLDNINIDKPIAIWLFSTGKPEEFSDFKKYGEVHFCSHMDEYQSFAHLIFADLLITSKSSFSYKPALMSDGIKVCPRNFWHGYPDAKDWILCENDGTFDVKKLKEALG